MCNPEQDNHIINAIFSARRLVLEYKRKNHGLTTPIQITAIKTPAEWSGSNKVVGMLDVAISMTGKEIAAVEYSPSPGENPVDAFIISDVNSKKFILVADHNNFCWKRFYLCKELCHALMNDHESLRTLDADACRRLIIDLKSPPLPQEALYPAYVAEHAAYLGAIEMLLPPEFFDDIKRLNGCITTHEIALKYRVPRFIIEQIVIESNLIKIIERIRKQQQYINLQYT